MNLLIGFFTIILILTSLLMILIILMQKAKTDGGMGAALGGGAAESAFGAETNNILTRGTIYCAILFFVVSFGLYLGHQYQRHQASPVNGRAPLISPVEPDVGAQPEDAAGAETDGAEVPVPEVPLPEEGTE
ncbi:MAG: preprotein translocase subunit SecG [Opitutales bacterium]